MKKTIILIAALILLLPALGFSDMLTIRLGYYMPQAVTDSYLASHPDSLWAIEFGQTSLRPSDYRGSILGLGYEFFVSSRVSVALSVDYFDHENGGFYTSYVSNQLNEGVYAFPSNLYSGSDILQTFHVSMVPVELSLKLSPLGRRTRFIPYVGGGLGAYFVHAAIFGSIIDFSQPATYADPILGNITVYPVQGAAISETKLTLGGHAFAGVEFPIGYRMTLEAEARYRRSPRQGDATFSLELASSPVAVLAFTRF